MLMYNAMCFTEQQTLSVGCEGRRSHQQERAL